jgi:hypothetical protein
MVHKVWGQTDPPSGLGRISVPFLALNIYVMSHHALPRVSIHLKIRQDYFLFGMLKIGFGGEKWSSRRRQLDTCTLIGNFQAWVLSGTSEC